MTPAKKATPTLKDALKGKDEDPVATSPVESEESVATSPEESVADDSILVPADKDHVHTWTEDHDQNLARLQKDVTVVETAHPAAVQVTAYATAYADPAENDDKGRALIESEEPPVIEEDK